MLLTSRRSWCVLPAALAMLAPPAAFCATLPRIENGSMTEGGESPAGWESGKNTRAGRDTAECHSAPASMCVSLVDGASDGMVSQRLEGAAGTEVEIAAWIRSSGRDSGLVVYQLVVHAFSGDWKEIRWHTLYMQNFHTGGDPLAWQLVRGKASLPPEAANVFVRIFVKGTGKVWVDDVAVVEPGGAPPEAAGAGAAARPAAPERGGDSYYLRPGDRVLVLSDAVLAEGGVLALALGDDMRRQYPGLAAAGALTVIDASVAGQTAAGALASLDDLVVRHRPTVAVVCLGLNDSYRDVGGFRAAAAGIVRALVARSVAVTVLTPPAIDARSRGELAERASALADMVVALRQVAAAERAVFADCHGPMQRRIDGGEDVSLGDGVHPDARGRRMMADALQEAWGFGRPLRGAAK